jgi:hypothetical protein
MRLGNQDHLHPLTCQENLPSLYSLDSDPLEAIQEDIDLVSPLVLVLQVLTVPPVLQRFLASNLSQNYQGSVFYQV